MGRTVGGKDEGEEPEKAPMLRTLASIPMGRELLSPHPTPETETETETDTEMETVDRDGYVDRYGDRDGDGDRDRDENNVWGDRDRPCASP